MRAISAHLHACATCRETLEELKVVDALLATTAPVTLAPNFTYAVMAEVRALPLLRTARFSHWALLSFYTIGAWMAIIAFWLIARATAAATLQGLLNSTYAWFTGTAATVGIATHALAPFAPYTMLAVVVVGAIDVALFAALAFYQHTIRPHVLATVIIPEDR